MNSILPDGKSLWIRAFYGFSPEEDGYAGWTQEAGRDHILKHIKDGDLILIYGAGSKETDKALRSYVLGFLQVDAAPIRDRDKAAPESLRRKAERGWAEKWTHAIPVRRAWRAEEKLLIRTIAFRTYRPEAGQSIAVWGAPLDPDEIAQALKIKVTEVNVFGEPPISETHLQKAAFGDEFRPSRAFPGSFGTHSVTRHDGETVLYLARFQGNGQALLNRTKVFGDKSVALKVGVASDVAGRLAQLNAGIPPAAQGRWTIYIQAFFPDRRSAEQAEQEFKARSVAKLESLGGEFFWGNQESAMLLFTSIPGVARF
ncbi:GIY-YIG nuclease family protein (plasmid) [Cereibacter azotoformans]|uniref:GIY-YIG nuclease family protein n=1 Tax=Cereibacter azotoformans TaxID=43057 RepID=UPI003B211E10